MMEFRILIAGSRTFKDYDRMYKEVTKYIYREPCENLITVVSGGANGADKLAERYAKHLEFKFKLFPANWDKYGKPAGMIRNEEMGQYCDEAIIFWDGKSRGAKGMINILNKLNKPFKIIEFN